MKKKKEVTSVSYERREGAFSREYNVTFGVLSALAIIMIVAGHSGYDILSVGGLFPTILFMYRSLCLFLVISIGKRRRAGLSRI